MDGEKKVTIASEADAFELLQSAVRNEIGETPLQISFDGWPKIEIRLVGEGYHSTITPDIAEGIVELQRAINRAYSRLAHGATARKLADDEKDQIRLKAKVEEGSSLITADLGNFAEALARELVAKMTPEMLVISVVGTAVVAGATIAYKSFLKHRSEDKKVSVEMANKLAMSQEETKRLEVVTEALARNNDLKTLQADFDEVRNGFLRGVGDAKSLAVNDLAITHDDAKVVAMAARTPSEEAQLNGTYHVIATDLSTPDVVRLRIKRVQDGMEFHATFQDNSLDQTQILQLQQAEWGRTTVFLSINATIRRGEVTKATVISVTPQPSAANDTAAS
ncbi:hypothetical protein [Burkholderia pseudomallei]|uniref:hypothetical protein n=1 Tax=Burkholderia pseudomallei TaxID=28450 RepID=UPI0005D81F62|nr:hypothetical protein [Burkholderia pseudomallei]AJX96673.1 hypothetical protein BG24_691 [Burkholderia pseudomallei PB08298010]